MTDGWTIATAIGTLLAAAVPAGLFFVERHDRKKAQTDLDDELKRQAAAQVRQIAEQRSAEARRVAIWNEYDDRGSPVVVHVLNGSSDPVFEVHAWTKLADKSYRREDGSTPSLGLGTWKVLKPGEQVHCSTRQAAPMPTWLEFTDVQQRHWVRRADGVVRLDSEHL